MTDESRAVLERMGICPGDVVTSNASSGVPLYRDLHRYGPWTTDHLPFAWFPPGGLGLVLAVAMSHDEDSEARPALLLARSMESAHVMGWTVEPSSFEALRGWRPVP